MRSQHLNQATKIHVCPHPHTTALLLLLALLIFVCLFLQLSSDTMSNLWPSRRFCVAQFRF